MYFVWFSLWHDGNWCSFSILVFLHHIVICFLRIDERAITVAANRLTKYFVFSGFKVVHCIQYVRFSIALDSCASKNMISVTAAQHQLKKMCSSSVFFLKAVAHKMKKKFSDRFFFLHTTLYMKKDRIISGNFVPTFIRLLNEIKWNKWIVKW